MFAEGGGAAFFRGGIERAVQQGPQMAVTLCSFDVGVNYGISVGWLPA